MSNQKGGISLGHLALLGVVGYVVAAAIYYVVISGFLSQDSEFAGHIGDSWGAFNAFFAGLGAVGVVVAIYLQHQQLQAQSKEISELTERAERQRFEEVFYQLLKTWNDHSAKLYFGESSGREAYGSAWYNISQAGTVRHLNEGPEYEKNLEAQFRKIWPSTLKPVLGQHIRMLELLIWHIYESGFEKEELYFKHILVHSTDDEKRVCKLYALHKSAEDSKLREAVSGSHPMLYRGISLDKPAD